MRFLATLPLIGLIACSDGPNHLGNPLLLPVSGLSNAIGNAAYNQRRGRVETLVKSSWPDILRDIDAGDGPVLQEAMNIAGIPEVDRPARVLQLQGDRGLYAQNPGALVVALMVYGG